MPAMLIECCFVDSSNNGNRCNSEDIANAIVKGLMGETSGNTINVNVQKSSKMASSDWVRRLQEECNRQGFSNQVVDGVQRPNTLAGYPTLRSGARGNITKLLPERLV